MRHYKKRGMKLGTDASHTKAIKRSLACALFANDRIKTTIQRAKAIRGDIDRIVTWAKRGDLASRRNAIARLGDASLVREVFEKAAQGMWADRNGGYTRIIKLGPRKGDNAEVVIIEIVSEPVAAKKAAKAPVASKKASAKKVAPKKAAVQEEKPSEEAKSDNKAQTSDNSEDAQDSESPKKEDESQDASAE